MLSSLFGVLVLAGLVAPPGGGADPEFASGPAPGAEEIRKGASGDEIACGDGATIRSAFSQEGESFVLVGTLDDVFRRSGLLIGGPVGEVQVSLDRLPDVDGEFYGGEAIKVTGKVASDGTLQADRVTLACGQALVREVGAEASDEEPATPEAPVTAPPTAHSTPPPETDPPVTEPAVTNPPTTDPPATEPPPAVVPPGDDDDGPQGNGPPPHAQNDRGGGDDGEYDEDGGAPGQGGHSQGDDDDDDDD